VRVAGAVQASVAWLDAAEFVPVAGANVLPNQRAAAIAAYSDSDAGEYVRHWTLGLAPATPAVGHLQAVPLGLGK